jgi:hypothetical protein
LATEAFTSAYGRLPNDVEFIGSVIENAADCGLGADCGGAARCATGAVAAGTAHTCEFDVVGNTPYRDDAASAGDGCAAGNGYWAGSGDENCYFHYYGENAAAGNGETHFRIAARSFGIPDTVFVYDNAVGQITECPDTGVADATYANATDGTPCTN